MDELLLDMMFNQFNQTNTVVSIFNNIWLWIILVALIPILLKFLVVAGFFTFLIRGSRMNKSIYKKGPIGFLGPLFGVPEMIQKSENEIRSEREHLYKKWGFRLSTLCILGGILLFVIGIKGNTDVQLTSIVTLQNAAPGTILFVVGFLILKNVLTRR